MQGSNIQLEEQSMPKVSLDGDKLQKGLAKLVLVIVELLRQVLERQAQRRIELRTLSEVEVERLGVAFMQIKEKVGQISEQFGLKPDEIEGTLRGVLRSRDSQLEGTSLVDVLDRLLVKGAVIGGQITVSVADIDLVALDLLATLSAIPSTTNEAKRDKQC